MTIRKVSANGLSDGSITSAKLATGAVTTAKITDLNVTSAKLATGAIDATAIGTGAITTTKIADLAVTSAKIGTGAVGTTNITDGSVTTAKIADSHVTTAKIAGLAVTSAKIGTGAVDTAQLNTAAVTTAKIADLNITSAKLATGAIGTNQLATGAVSLARLASAAALSVLGNTGSSTGSVAAISFTELSTYIKPTTIVSGGNLDAVTPVGTAANETLLTVTVGTGAVSSFQQHVEFSVLAVLDGTTGTPGLSIAWDGDTIADLSGFTLPSNAVNVSVSGRIFYRNATGATVDTEITVYDTVALSSVTIPSAPGGHTTTCTWANALNLDVIGNAPSTVGQVSVRTVLVKVVK